MPTKNREIKLIRIFLKSTQSVVTCTQLIGVTIYTPKNLTSSKKATSLRWKKKNTFQETS